MTESKKDKEPTINVSSKKTFATTWQDAYDRLSLEFPKDLAKHTKKDDTKKGYDTTGIPYQYCVNRLNEVVGPQNWNYTYSEKERVDGKTQSGNLKISLTFEVEISVTLENVTVTKKCYGGHTSNNFADAAKGAFTNGFKKTAAMFGVGRQAYEGSLDDDNVAPEANKNANIKVNKTFETAKRMIKALNDIDKLMEASERTKNSKIYSKEEKDELEAVILERVNAIEDSHANQTNG